VWFFFFFLRDVVFRWRWWGWRVSGSVCFLQQKTAFETEKYGWFEIDRAGRVLLLLLLFVVGFYGHYCIISVQAWTGWDLRRRR